MDGMHRVAKAILLDLKTIEAVQFEQDPEPDYYDVSPDDLSYDEAPPPLAPNVEYSWNWFGTPRSARNISS